MWPISSQFSLSAQVKNWWILIISNCLFYFCQLRINFSNFILNYFYFRHEMRWDIFFFFKNSILSTISSFYQGSANWRTCSCLFADPWLWQWKRISSQSFFLKWFRGWERGWKIALSLPSWLGTYLWLVTWLIYLTISILLVISIMLKLSHRPFTARISSAVFYWFEPVLERIKIDTMLLFGGNPGGSDLERFSDLWRLDLQHDSHVITEVHNLIKICKYHYLLSQDKSSAACLYLRSLQHIGTDMKAQESFKNGFQVPLPV